MNRRNIVPIILALAALTAHAQIVIEGHVLNAHGKAVDAYVTAARATTGSTLGFADTNDRGHYKLEINTTADSLTITVGGLAIARQVKVIEGRSQRLDFCIREQNIELKEVTVRAKKLRQSGDTISYTASTYLGKEDKVLKDLLKKMPGISISSDGQIAYNGKWISEFYIEGTDMLGERYNIATTNINAQDIATVQVIEKHQEAKVLQGWQRGDSPAINITLRNIAKGIRASALDAALGIPALSHDVSLNLMNFKPRRQNISFYKTNDVGIDLRRDIKAPANMNADVGMGILLPTKPSLDDSYAYRNDSHSLSVNQLHKLDDDHLLTYNINYLHDRERRNSSERSHYFITADSTMTILEDNGAQGKMHYLNANLNYKVNTRRLYLKEALVVSTAFNCGRGLINTKIAQHLNNHSVEITNRLTAHRNRANGSVADFSSVVAFCDKDAHLSLPQLRQDIHLLKFETENSLSLFSRRIPHLMYSVNATAALTYQHVTTAIISRNNSMEVAQPSAHVVPRLLFHHGERFQLLVYIPLGIRYYHVSDLGRSDYEKAYFSSKPYANVSYKPNSHFQYDLTVNYEETLPTAMELLSSSYYTNYRTTFANSQHLQAGLQRAFKASASASYNDVIRMLFANITLAMADVSSQNSTAYRFQGNETDYYLSPIGTGNRVYQADQTFSKGFFKFNSKVQESLSVGRSKSEYLIDEMFHHSRTDYLKASISYNAAFSRWLTLTTTGTYSLSQPYTDGKRGSDLYHTFSNATTATLWAGRSILLNTQAQYCYNNYFTHGGSNFFMNERIEYRLKSTIFSVECINLLDRTTICRIIDNGVTRFAGKYQLRGRTIMAGIRVKLL